MADIDNRYTSLEYVTRNADWHEGRADWKAGQVAHMLTNHAIAPRSVCDIGCGTGGVLDELKSLLPDDIDMVGYEISQQAIDLIPAERKQKVEIVNGAHDVDDRRFDLMLCLDVFEHVEDYYGFLRQIRAKAPLAIFHIPIDTAVTSVLRPGPVLKSYQQVGHIQHFTRTLAIEALKHSGYEVVDAFHTVPARDHAPVNTRQRIGRLARLIGARINLDLSAKLMTGFPLLVLAKTNTEVMATREDSQGHPFAPNMPSSEQ